MSQAMGKKMYDTELYGVLEILTRPDKVERG